MQAETSKFRPTISSILSSPALSAAIMPRLMLRNRAEIEDAIDHLIGLLDLFDPDPDLEPSLGWNEDGDAGPCRSVVDCEEESDFEPEELCHA